MTTMPVTDSDNDSPSHALHNSSASNTPTNGATNAVAASTTIAAAAPPATQSSASRRNDDPISAFIRKTYNMVSDPATDHIVCWSTNGDQFIVKQEYAFAQTLLPVYFRHKNFSSFVRQLNFYGFHKRQTAGKFVSFAHPNFRRGNIAALKQIKRKGTTSESANTHSFKGTVGALSSQVRELKEQYADLFKIQQQILYIFSRYMRAHPPNNAPQSPRRLKGPAARLMLPPAVPTANSAVVDGIPQMERAHLSPIHSPNSPVTPPFTLNNSNRANVQIVEEDDANDDDAGALNGDTDEENLDDGIDDDGDFRDLHDEDDDEDVTKSNGNTRAQVYAQLQSLHQIINELPTKDEFIMNLPKLTLPPRVAPSKSGRNISTASTASNTSGPRSKRSTSAVTARERTPPVPTTDDEETMPFSPPPPLSATYNAFEQHDQDNQQTNETTNNNNNANGKTPKLLYSKEHYAKMEDDAHHREEKGGDKDKRRHKHKHSSVSSPNARTKDSKKRKRRDGDAANGEERREHKSRSTSSPRAAAAMPLGPPMHYPQSLMTHPHDAAALPPYWSVQQSALPITISQPISPIPTYQHAPYSPAMPPSPPPMFHGASLGDPHSQPHSDFNSQPFAPLSPFLSPRFYTHNSTGSGGSNASLSGSLQTHHDHDTNDGAEHTHDSTAEYYQ